jgi:hypothetical protein
MNLSDEQKQTIAQRLADGESIADIQRLITSEFGVAMTFMETRFLLDDLNLDLKEEEPKPEPDDAVPAEAASSDMSASEDAALENGSLSVDIDKIVRPGSAISGTVTFSDGVAAKWYVDQMGRLGLDPDQEGYQPSESDIQAFQTELQAKMQAPGI